jgi:phage terminase large subunit-like protein
VSLRSAFIALGVGRTVDDFAAQLAGYTAEQLAGLSVDWRIFARDDQLPPDFAKSPLDWRTWLILGGRGAGKTRAGAEWVRAQVLAVELLAEQPARRIALVGETIGDVRRVMIEGVSGILSVHADHERPEWQSSLGRLTWPNGAIAEVFSACEPDSLRGPQFDTAWCDELAKWPEPERAWDMLQFALRLGTSPRALVTTTPRPIPLLKSIMEDASTVTTRARTLDNAENLAPGFVEQMSRRYAGTALGRQELDGEIIDERAGALWRRDWIEAQRLEDTPELRGQLLRIVVAVDPPVTATATSDACGIIVAGLGADGRAYVLADRTVQGREAHVWAGTALAAYSDFLADRIVAEVNQGGDLVAIILRQSNRNVPVRQVRATRGKWVRAEPIAALYAEGRVVHAGTFPQLEDQMCVFGADGLARGKSPDRLDALVWALTDLMLDVAPEPMMRRL